MNVDLVPPWIGLYTPKPRCRHRWSSWQDDRRFFEIVLRTTLKSRVLKNSSPVIRHRNGLVTKNDFEMKATSQFRKTPLEFIHIPLRSIRENRPCRGFCEAGWKFWKLPKYRPPKRRRFSFGVWRPFAKKNNLTKAVQLREKESSKFFKVPSYFWKWLLAYIDGSRGWGMGREQARGVFFGSRALSVPSKRTLNAG